MFKVFSLFFILGLVVLTHSRALQDGDGVGPLEPGQTTFVNQGTSDIPEPSNRPHFSGSSQSTSDVPEPSNRPHFSGGNSATSDVPEPSTRPHFSGGHQHSSHHHNHRQPDVLEPGQTNFKKQHKSHGHS